MGALEVPEPPPAHEAWRALASVSMADWWVDLFRAGFFREPEKKMASKALAWAVGAARAAGLKVYRKDKVTLEVSPAAAVRARARGGYRIIFAAITDHFEVKLKGELKGKYRVPLGAVAIYASMDRKNARLYDRLLPRYKRAFIANGYVVVMQRTLAGGRRGGDPGAGGGGSSRLLGDITDTILHGGTSEGIVENTAPEAGGVAAAQAKALKARLAFREIIACRRAAIVFREYKGKYILFIPPLIIWKWVYLLYPDSLLREEASPELCDRVVG